MGHQKPDTNNWTGHASALSLQSVTKSFGDFRALDQTSFSVDSGQIHALLGENGAGKSTLMNVACGLYAPDAGTLSVNGKAKTFVGPRDAAAEGIGMVHQHFKLVPSFSVIENILLFFNPGPSFRAARRDVAERTIALAKTIDFELDLHQRAGDLSIAEQQRVEILKVLVAGARIVILDEPTAVLSEEESINLMQLIRRLADAGTAVVLVTHKLREALDHCDRITVMRAGCKIAEVAPGDMDTDSLTTMIVGEHIVEQPKLSQNRGDPLIRFKNISVSDTAERNVVSNTTFEVASGEIYGIAGVGGNGQSELAAAIMALSTPTNGQIEIIGTGDVTHDRPPKRRRDGVAAIPVDRYKHGLSGHQSILENFAIAGTMRGEFGSWFRFHKFAAKSKVEEAIISFDVQGVRNVNQRASLLSGGNGQKLVISREFGGSPKIVLAHSPSRGLDVRASAAVHDRLRWARDAGAAIILISEDLDEILLLADRIGVLNRGRITAEFNSPAQRIDIGQAMVSHG